MGWTLEVETALTEAVVPWAQWVDREAVTAWMERGTQLLNMAVPDASTRANYPGQRAWVIEAYRSISGILRGINTPAAACPYVAAAQRTYIGGGEGPSGGTYPAGRWYNDASEILARHVRRYTEAQEDGDSVWVRVLPRLTINPNDSTLATPYVDTGAPDESMMERGFDGSGIVCGGAELGTWWCTGYAWWFPGFLSASNEGEAALFPALEWHAQYARSVLVELCSRTWRDVITRSRAYVILKNVEEVTQWVGEDAVPEDLFRVRSDVEALRYTTSEGAETFREIGRPLAGAAFAVNPLAGAIIGVVAELPAALEGIAGTSVGNLLDMWGRRAPVFEKAYIGGVLTTSQIRETRRAPDFVVALPGRLAPELEAFNVTVLRGYEPAEAADPSGRGLSPEPDRVDESVPGAPRWGARGRTTTVRRAADLRRAAVPSEGGGGGSDGRVGGARRSATATRTGARTDSGGATGGASGETGGTGGTDTGATGDTSERDAREGTVEGGSGAEGGTGDGGTGGVTGDRGSPALRALPSRMVVADAARLAFASPTGS